jgi:hypothetical protein
MRKGLVALVGTVVLGALPASAAARQFAFEGSAANGNAPVEMTMTGNRLNRPLHVTSFSIGMDLVKEDCPGYSGKDPLPIPVHRGSGGPHGIRIRPRSNGQLYFEWHNAGGPPYEQLQGAQLGPRKWIGEFSIDWLPGWPPGGDYHCYSNYEPQWLAKLVPP